MVESGGADELHLDSMDGRFVPNLTWGMKIVRDLRKLTTLPFDCHLMIVEPEKYVDAFRDAGADIITFHYEATPHQHRLLQHLRAIGAKAGIAINPGTPVSMLVDLIEEIDRVLVMSVNPGFGGQSFIERALVKVAEVRALLDARNPACEIEVDGGIGLENIERAVEAGADVLVAGTRCSARPIRPSDARHAPPHRRDPRGDRGRAGRAIRERLRDVDAARLLVGIGDDAAVWQPSRSNRSVITTDALVEGVHFTRAAMSARDAGHRALASNLSDIAAMGARPVLATIALGFPRGTDPAWMLDCYDGIAALAKRARCAIAGGDLTRAPAIVLAITVVGEVRASNLKRAPAHARAT